MELEILSAHSSGGARKAGESEGRSTVQVVRPRPEDEALCSKRRQAIAEAGSAGRERATSRYAR
jgi:hypothetical protein